MAHLMLPWCPINNEHTLDKILGRWPTIVSVIPSLCKTAIAKRSCSLSSSLAQIRLSPTMGVQMCWYTWWPCPLLSITNSLVRSPSMLCKTRKFFMEAPVAIQLKFASQEASLQRYAVNLLLSTLSVNNSTGTNDTSPLPRKFSSEL